MAEKYGEYECNQHGIEYQMDKETLGNDIKNRYYQIIEEKKNNKQGNNEQNDGENEPNDTEPELNGDEVQKPTEAEESHIDQASNDGTDLAPNDLRTKITENAFMESWKYAHSKIIPFAYKDSISMNDTTNKYYSSTPSSPSFYCRGLKSYRNLMDKRKDIPWGPFWAFILIGICAIFGAIFCLRSNTKQEESEMDQMALNAANLCLDALSQNQKYHFSIDRQLRSYAVSRLNVSDETWKKAVKYVKDSDYVKTEIDEEIYPGNITKCWKWKAPVPFVPLSNQQ